MKPTDKNTILKYESCHPRKMIRSLPFSQMLHVRRIVDQEKEVDGALQHMVKNFLQWGYPKNIVEDHRNMVKCLNREQAMKSKPKTKMNKILCVLTFNDWSDEIAKVMNKHLPIVRESYKGIEAFKINPLLSYKRLPKLGDKLVRSDIGPGPTYKQSFVSTRRLGCYQCLSCINYTIGKGIFLYTPRPVAVTNLDII